MRETGTGTLELRDVVKRYRDSVAVDGISLEARAGEFLTLLGPSGSGKTTTLGMIAGFVEQTSGEIVLDGQDLSGLRPHKRDIGVVFQNYALFPHMTAAENVGFPLKMRGVSGGELSRKVNSALELVQLQGLGGRRPRELSGGQQQRVAFARAIVFEPRLLLMDEPLGALDKKMREVLQLEVMRISRRLGISVVYVTHDQEEALVMSDRIAIYNMGRIEQIGTAEDLYERPSTLFVADFIGDSNIVRGKLLAGRPTPRFGWAGGEVHVESRGEGLNPGDAAAFVIRPERVQLLPPGTSLDAGTNRARGTVKEVVYLGNARRYSVALPDGTVLNARVQAAGASAGVAAGEDVELGWQPHDGVVLADPGV
ncbi:ABC transporter ATP-binding protein [Nonomuraea turcica]|uniref:ABC transporter ATP-binding protein n=1 Tax=Nonomuraea sp. G32 TaxID=3067274 RepID=UPI00273C9026|nr:ABC transporter ATP-binding protein [Nonomuraea sp. G32]MDP4506959.1 ABC transporter ATP-binding protein [Nonomuraea sp. G32]